MKDSDSLQPRRRHPRSLDRWAWCLVLGLQVAILLMRWSTRRQEHRPQDPELQTSYAPRTLPLDSGSPRNPRRSSRIPTVVPVSFGGSSHRIPASVESAASERAWKALRQLPALDVRELETGYEVRLSVPPPNGKNAQAYVVGRRVDIEVPLDNDEGLPIGRLFRQVLLPSQPCAEQEPRIEYADGILRIYLLKP